MANIFCTLTEGRSAHRDYRPQPPIPRGPYLNSVMLEAFRLEQFDSGSQCAPLQFA